MKLKTFLELSSDDKEVLNYNPFHSVEDQYFPFVRNPDINPSLQASERIIRLLLYHVDQISTEKCNQSQEIKDQWNAFTFGIESNLLLLWSNLYSLPMYEFIGVNKPNDKYCYYTIGISDDIQEINHNLEFGSNYTPFLKLKVSQSIPYLHQVIKHVLSSGLRDFHKIAVDANGSWTPEFAVSALNEVFLQEGIKDRIYMLEQPFPVSLVNLSDEEKLKWQEVKERYKKEGIVVFADESVRDYQDVEPLSPYIGGVNVKLEKTGGIRNAIRTISVAKSFGLQVWIGTMVGSCLNCNFASLLLPLSTIGGDLDGVLLVDPTSFRGGFQWLGNGHLDCSHPFPSFQS